MPTTLQSLALTLCLTSPTVATVQSIGVYSTPAKADIRPVDLSAFFAGYLGNEKNYAVRNLDLFYLGTEKAALAKARALALDALLIAETRGFAPGDPTATADLRLIETATGDTLRQWTSPLVAPYFDPPYFRHSRPYGNLAEVFADFEPLSYDTSREIRLLAVTDQDLSANSPVGPYLRAQLDIAARVLAREAGIRLILHRLVHWDPPSASKTDSDPAPLDLFDTARAAVRIPGRSEADLTLISLGPPAPFHTDQQTGAIGYARVLGNIIATRRTNAHVIVHEIAHVLGAIHIAEKGAIMRPALELYSLGNRFEVLPPIRFSPLNRRIIAITRTLPLGTDLANHFDKITQLLAVYEELQATHLESVAPYYGDLLLNTGRTDEAIAIFAQALENTPQHRPLRALLAEALERAGRYREAQALVQREFDQVQALLKRRTGGALQLKTHPTLSLSASMLSFGQVPLSYKRKMPLTLSNLGTAPLQIQRIGTPKSPFSLDQPSQTIIAPGESLTLHLTFQPDEPKSYLTSIEIHSNAPKQHIAVVRLSGTGAE